MICPLYLLAQSNPKDPFLILNTHTISFGEMHLQVMSCERQLLSYPTHRPIAIDSTNTYALLSWILAAARTGHWIAIPSSKDPPLKRDHHLQQYLSTPNLFIGHCRLPFPILSGTTEPAINH